MFEIGAISVTGSLLDKAIGKVNGIWSISAYANEQGLIKISEKKLEQNSMVRLCVMALVAGT